MEGLAWATDGHKFSGVVGDPGWEIVRRDSSSPIDAPGYEDASLGEHRAYVELDEYYLVHSELFMSGNYFYEGVCSALERYVRGGWSTPCP